MYKVDDGSAAHDDAPDKDGPVHGDGCDLLGDWEEAHDEGESNVSEGKHVHRDGEPSHAPPAGWERLAFETLEEDAADGDEVAREERRDEQADNGVEGSGRTDVDEGKKDSDAERE